MFECPCEIGPPETPSSTKLYVKLESDYDKLVELKQFQCCLSLILEVSVHTSCLSSVKDGCIQLTFLIPSPLVIAPPSLAPAVLFDGSAVFKSCVATESEMAVENMVSDPEL